MAPSTLQVETERSTWEAQAACRASQHLFFAPTGGESAAERAGREAGAKVVCAGCPVRPDCLRYALRVRELLGIWGGLTAHERQRYFHL